MSERVDDAAIGRLESIWIKRMRRGPMDAVDVAELVEDRGIAGNANQNGRRQVTILAVEAWETMMAELDAALDPAARRANLLVRGIDLERSRDRLLRIGSCVIDIRGETRPCERMDEALPGLRERMKPGWRGGVFGTIVQGGTIRVGDPVRFDGWAEDALRQRALTRRNAGD